MWVGRRDLPLPRFRQAKHSLTLIFSRPDVDPPLLAQQGQRTCKRRAVHGKAGTQRFLVGLADNGEANQKALRDRKSTRLNSSHQINSDALFCLKKKKNTD